MKKAIRQKKAVTVKMEPLKGQFFDLKPAKKSKARLMILASAREYGRFALIAFFAFLVLNFGNAYLKGKDMIFQSSSLAYAGYADLEKGIGYLLNQDGSKATEAFMGAQKTFLELKKTTAPFTTQANQLVERSEHFETADTLVTVALEVSEMGQKLAQFSTSLKDIPQLLSESEKEGVLIQLLQDRKLELEQIHVLSISLQNKLVDLNVEVLPLELQEKIRQARQQVGEFVAILNDLDHLTDQLLTLLGDRVPHRYLILLQNNHELRATGGFMGSYLIIEMNDGKMTKMEAHDIYEGDGQLAKLLPPPPGIEKVAKHWYMRDSNYSPDFPTAAQQVMWFLEQTRGPSVDTVIALDQTVVEKILKLVGGIKVEGLDQEINAENFNQLISFYTEAKLSATNTPKQLLFDLIPRFKEKAMNFETALSLLSTFKEIRQGGHVQAYSQDPSLQALFHSFGLSGEIVKPLANMDYLNVVSTSVGGNKTDEFIETKIDHSTLIEANGELVDELTISKTHTYSEKDSANIQALIDQYGSGKLAEGDLKNILGQGKNLDYMRIYVPLGAEIEEVSGIDKSAIKVSEDLGYTVFGLMYGPLSPGETEQITIKYRLPFELNLWPVDNYRFVAQKQAGRENTTLHKTLKVQEPLKVEKAYPQPSEGQKNPVLRGEFEKTELLMVAVSQE